MWDRNRVSVWVDRSRCVGFGVSVVRLENEGEKFPGACSVLVGGRRWVGLRWVENSTEWQYAFGLLLKRWGYGDVDDGRRGLG
jgi:hypothetical protein